MSWLKLVLATRAVPLLSVDVDDQFKSAARQSAWIARREVGKLDWGRVSLPFHLLGFHSGQPRDDGTIPLQAIGLALDPALMTWFEGTDPRVEDLAPRPEWIVYQRGREQPPEGWLSLLFAKRVGTPIERAKVLEACASEAAVWARPGRLDNWSWLAGVVNWLQSTGAGVAGWTAMANASQGPPVKLLLVDRASPGWPMDAWEAQTGPPAGGWASRLAGASLESPSLGLPVLTGFALNDPATALEMLCSVGNNHSAGQVEGVRAEDRDKLLLCPGQVSFCEQPLFCRRIEYTFDVASRTMGGRAFLTDLSLAEASGAAPGLLVRRFQGEVLGWSVAPAGGPSVALDLKPSESAAWIGIVGDQYDGGEIGPLRVDAIQPSSFAAGRPGAGIYVRPKSGDQPEFMVVPGQAPFVLGGRQSQAAALEEAGVDIALQGESIAVVVGDRAAGPYGELGLTLSAKETVLQTAGGATQFRQAEGGVTLKGGKFVALENLTLTAQALSLTGSASIGGDATIAGQLEAGKA